RLQQQQLFRSAAGQRIGAVQGEAVELAAGQSVEVAGGPAEAGRQLVDHLEADVMPGGDVLAPGIAEADDQFHTTVSCQSSVGSCKERQHSTPLTTDR